MDFIQLARSRRSIRSYKPDPVPDEMVRGLIEAAQSAPSGGNCQPWHYYVVRTEAVKARIVSESCRQNWLLTAPVFIVVCADIKRSESRYGTRGRDLYCIQDTAAATQNMLLCAASLGLGTCWCGAFDETAMAAVLGLPAGMRPVALIPVGYPASSPSPTSRRPIEETTDFI